MDYKIMMLNYNVTFALCRIKFTLIATYFALNNARPKSTGAKLFCRRSTLKSTGANDPHCPYGVSAYADGGSGRMRPVIGLSLVVDEEG